MTAFLFEHDRRTNEFKLATFEDRENAIHEFGQRERVKDPEVEVVLLFAKSLESLLVTHPRYFWGRRVESTAPARG